MGDNISNVKKPKSNTSHNSKTSSKKFAEEKEHKIAQLNEPIMDWIYLLSLLQIAANIIILIFVAFELYGNKPMYTSSYGWTVVIGVYTIYVLLLILFEVVVFYTHKKKLKEIERKRLLHFINTAICSFVVFVIITGFAYYTYNLNSDTNLFEYQSNRNLISSLLISLILYTSHQFFSAIIG